MRRNLWHNVMANLMMVFSSIIGILGLIVDDWVLVLVAVWISLAAILEVLQDIADGIWGRNR